MKLIVSELGALERYVSREFHYVMTDLITNHDWRQVDTGKLWSGRRTMKEELLDAFGELPEVILFWEGYDFLAARAGNVRQLDCKKYIFADDLHWWEVDFCSQAHAADWFARPLPSPIRETGEPRPRTAADRWADLGCLLTFSLTLALIGLGLWTAGRFLVGIF